jgi:lipase chaperone LimK
MISGLQQIRKRFTQTEALSITDTRFADYIKYLSRVYKLDNRLGKRLGILFDGWMEVQSLLKSSAPL